MATEKQIAANRANAKKSTGPRTPEGKARSSLNALTHGLSARRAVLPNEDREAFDAFARAIRKDLRPSGPVQALVAEEVIEAAWKMQRAAEAQRRVVRYALARYAERARAVTPGRLLADAIGDDPRAAPFMKLERYADCAQRSFFSALRRFHHARKHAMPPIGEPNSETDRYAFETGASPAAADHYGRHPAPPQKSPSAQVPATNPFSPVFSGATGTTPTAGTR